MFDGSTGLKTVSKMFAGKQGGEAAKERGAGIMSDPGEDPHKSRIPCSNSGNRNFSVSRNLRWSNSPFIAAGYGHEGGKAGGHKGGEAAKEKGAGVMADPGETSYALFQRLLPP